MHVMLHILPVVTCMTEDALFTWTVVLPVKVLARAKSRLALLAGSRRADLALALASDTVSARAGRHVRRQGRLTARGTGRDRRARRAGRRPQRRVAPRGRGSVGPLAGQ